MIAWIILAVVNVLILFSTREPENLRIVKEKYEKLRQHLIETKNKKFEMLTTRVPLTGMTKTSGAIGYNVSKGSDIGICIDGDSNEIFHVLIHELAHSTVKEYKHSEQFWENFVELRAICEKLGIYKRITKKTEFCGKHVHDK